MMEMSDAKQEKKDRDHFLYTPPAKFFLSFTLTRNTKVFACVSKSRKQLTGIMYS